MKRARHALLGVVVSVAVLGGPAVVARADTAGGGDNVVVVHNLEDGALHARSRTVVSNNPTATIGNENYAEAYSSCTGCRTAAAAIQVVLVEGNPNDIEPNNVALAVNENCHFCQTFAYARQFLVSPHHPVELSDDAREQIDALGDQVADVVHSQESFDQMTADLDRLALRVNAVVQADIQRAGSSADVDEHRDVKEQHTDD